MATIIDAVKVAMSEWHEGGTDVETMIDMAEDFALQAVSAWIEADGAGSVPIVDECDADTILGSVFAAMNDWKSSGHEIGDMEDMVVQFIHRAAEDWATGGPAAKQTAVAP